MKKHTIAVRVDSERFQLIEHAAKTEGIPIASWCTSVLCRSVKGTEKPPVKKVEPTEAEIKKSVSEQVLTIMEGGQWFSKDDIYHQLRNVKKYSFNLVMNELFATGKIKDTEGVRPYKVRRVL